MLKLKIKETQETKTLSLIDPKTGVNWIADYIGNTGDMINGVLVYDAESDLYHISQDDYDYWADMVSMRDAVDQRMHDMHLSEKEKQFFDNYLNACCPEFCDECSVMTTALNEIDQKRGLPPGVWTKPDIFHDIKTLEELKDKLNSMNKKDQKNIRMDSLPNFGKEPQDTEEIFSWDDENVLLCDNDFYIAPRCTICGEATFHCICIEEHTDQINALMSGKYCDNL